MIQNDFFVSTKWVGTKCTHTTPFLLCLKLFQTGLDLYHFRQDISTGIILQIRGRTCKPEEYSVLGYIKGTKTLLPDYHKFSPRNSACCPELCTWATIGRQSTKLARESLVAFEQCPNSHTLSKRTWWNTKELFAQLMTKGAADRVAPLQVSITWTDLVSM